MTQHEIRPLTENQQQILMGSLNPARIQERGQGKAKLSYLAAWDVKATLIRAFGYGGFSAEALECSIIRIEDNIPKSEWVGGKKTVKQVERDQFGNIVFGTANFRVTARVQVRLTIHQTGAIYTEWASSSQTGPDIGEVSDFAIKTAESDALKRAAIYLGTQFGLSLYNAGATADVVNVVFSPGQEWWGGTSQRQAVIENERQRQAQEDSKTSPEAPTEQPLTHVPEDTQPSAQPVSNPEQMQGYTQHPNVTQEQHEANQQLLSRALDAKPVQDSAQDQQ